MAVLHVRGRWALGIEPIAWRGENHWLCMSEDGYDVVYDGSTEVLRRHVAAIQAGRATTITARAPRAYGSRDHSRMCRIKASFRITTFILSDESPHFVGWGTGDPEEVTKLVQALGGATSRRGAEGTKVTSLYELVKATYRFPSSRHRITAAADLARLGPAGRPALPALRRTLGDPDHDVALAAALALVRLAPDDDLAIKAIAERLGASSPRVRSAAVETLGKLGPKARPALPGLLRALRDKDKNVRAAGASAIGRVAPVRGPPMRPWPPSPTG